MTSTWQRVSALLLLFAALSCGEGAARDSSARDAGALDAGGGLSLRASSEEPFDEETLVSSLGGTFYRYYLHCASSNRAGATWALYHAERLGYAGEEAIQNGRDAGLSGLESVVREILGLI